MAKDPNSTIIMKLLEGESELLLDVDTVSFRPPLALMPVDMLTSKKIIRANTKREFIKHIRKNCNSVVGAENRDINPPVQRQIFVRTDVTPNTKSETVSRKKFLI